MKDQMTHAEAMCERAELLETIEELRAELYALESQQPKAFVFEDADGELSVIGAEHYDGTVKAYPLFARPVPATPEGVVLVPVDPVPSAVAAMARDIQSKGGFISGDTYRACIAAAQKVVRNEYIPD